jgi:hypothetical protein
MPSSRLPAAPQTPHRAAARNSAALAAHHANAL